MALDFPTSPALNQVYTFGSYSWRWDGTSWVGAVPIVNATINNTTIGAVTPSTGAFTTLSATGQVNITGGTLSQLQSQAGSVYFEQVNTNTGAGAGVQIFQYNSGAGAGGDASIRQFTGAQNWIFGIDNSDGDKWKVSASDTLGTSDVLAVSTTGLAVTGTGTFSGLVTATSGAAIRGNSTPASGSGMELLWDGTQSVVQSYNRTGSAYLPLWYDALNHQWNTSGTSRMTLNSTGLQVTGALSCTTGLTLNDGSVNSPNINFQTTSGTRIMDMDGSTVRILNMASTNARLQLTDAGNLSVDGTLSCVGALAIGNTVNTVSPTSPNRTVTIVIGGTTYYLAAKTTND